MEKENTIDQNFTTINVLTERCNKNNSLVEYDDLVTMIEMYYDEHIF